MMRASIKDRRHPVKASKPKRETTEQIIARAIGILAPFNGGKILEARKLLETLTKAKPVAKNGASIRSKLTVGMEQSGIVDCYGLRIDTYRFIGDSDRPTPDTCIYCDNWIGKARAAVVTNHWTRKDNGAEPGLGTWNVSHGLAHVGCQQGFIRAQIWAQFQAIEERRLQGELIILNARLCDCGHTADHHVADANDNLLACDMLVESKRGADDAIPCECDHFQQHKSQVAEQLPIVMEHDDDGNMIELENEDYQESAQA